MIIDICMKVLNGHANQKYYQRNQLPSTNKTLTKK